MRALEEPPRRHGEYPCANNEPKTRPAGHPHSPGPVAIGEHDAPGGLAWLGRMRGLGRSAVLVQELSDFQSGAGEGIKFEALLLLLRDKFDWAPWVSACEALGVPVLLVVEESLCDRLLVPLSSTNGGQFRGYATMDFAVLPVSDFEIDARIDALVRRTCSLIPRDFLEVDIAFGGYTFVAHRHMVFRAGVRVHVTPREFELALLLFRNEGRTLDREWILSLLWGNDGSSTRSRALDTCIANIRKKLALQPENGFVLLTTYNGGYQIRRVVV